MPLEASTVYVPAGGDLQQALDAAQPGDTILLAEGAEFVGNFVLPLKNGDGVITLRSASPDAVLPQPGQRIRPAHAHLLARLRSPNTAAALRTAPGAHHWTLSYLEFAANLYGAGDIIQIGDGSKAQDTLDEVPHHFRLTHLYIHGDPRVGQKRGIALNAAHVTIADSHISECKGIGQDTQAIAGWNGPGPYVIENNYLEAAGENVMFGGADPAIPNLVADGITFRRNYLSRPFAWRQPILATPQSLTASAEAGGSLGAGTYAYRVVARGVIGQTWARSTASVELSAVVESTAGAIRLRWAAVQGASEYRVYGRVPGAQATSWTVTGTEFVDTGQAGTTEAVPATAGTVWSVKNLFELKNARNVVVEGNVLENHWKESQPGWAIVLTPRNSNGACSWCVVENVRFEYNIVRHVSAGINLLGYDIASRPTLQTSNILIRHNLFHDVTAELGGRGWFLQIGDEPRDIVVEHNTVSHDGTTILYTYGGTSTDPREIYGFQMTANAVRHGAYGVHGDFFSYGNAILNGFYPGHVFTANYLAGGPASRYPAGNLFAGAFDDQFVDVAGADFTVRAGSALEGAAPDGSNVGVDMPELQRRVLGVDGGVSGTPPAADFAFSCTALSCTFTSTSVASEGQITAHAWQFGDGLEPGAIQAAGLEVTHVFADAGAYPVTLTVSDSSGLSSSVTRLVTVESRNVAPVAGFTAACTDLQCTFADASRDSDGEIAFVAWSFSDGASAEGAQVTRAFAAPGTYSVAVTATDDDGAVATATQEVNVRALVHGAVLGSATRRWDSKNRKTHYWSTEVTVGVHGADERPIANATVTAAWSGAVNRTATCVTGVTGQCVLASGTLSMHRPTVTLTVTNVAAPVADYAPLANHDGAGALTSSATIIKP
jgi:PKD repeat protein